MNPTSTNNFNRYKQRNFGVDMHSEPRFNPIADLTLPYNTTVLNPLKTVAPPQPTLTSALNKQIFSTLRTKEKEFVDEVNYYQNLNRHGQPAEMPQQMNHTLGRNKNRFVRGESYAQEGEMLESGLMTRNQSYATGLVPQKKKEDFLDRFIQRQDAWKGYYKNNDKLESLKCDRHPDFLTNSEFLPNNKENNHEYDPEAFNGMKKSKLLPNSVVVDRNYKELEMDRQWAKNYSLVLNNQKVLKDVNCMDLDKYNKLSKQVSHPYIHNESDVRVDPALKKSILGVYHQI